MKSMHTIVHYHIIRLYTMCTIHLRPNAVMFNPLPVNPVLKPIIYSVILPQNCLMDDSQLAGRPPQKPSSQLLIVLHVIIESEKDVNNRLNRNTCQ